MMEAGYEQRGWVTNMTIPGSLTVTNESNRVKSGPPIRHWTLGDKMEETSNGGTPEGVQRWMTKRKSAVVLSILKGETSAQEAARKHGLTVGEVEDWKEKFLLGAENALRARPKDEEALKDEQIKKLKQKLGEMVLDMDIMKEAMRPYRPTTPGTSEE
jgi:transposase-like protein